MPYPPHWRLQFGGPLFGGEDWSCSINMSSFGLVFPPPDLMEQYARDWVTDMANDVKAFFLNPKSHFNPGAKLAYVKFNVIGPDGRYVNKTVTHEETWNHTPVPDPGTQQPAPPQQACAISLRTNVKRGPGSHGRFFIPLAGVAIDAASGQMAAPTPADLRDASVTFLNALNNIPGLDPGNEPNVAVVSPLGGGKATKVTAVAVGSVVDSQRRRRKSIPEVYTNGAIS